MAAGYRWPQFSIHRGKLQMLLLEAVRERVGADRIHAGWHLTDWREEGGNIVASFVDKKSDASRGEVTGARSEEHTSELQSLMRISYAVFCLKKKTKNKTQNTQQIIT